MPVDTGLSALTERCTQLCIDLLGAALENVHIQYLSVSHGRGRPVSAELTYRLEPARTTVLMDEFMRQLDLAIQHHAGLAARIRCVGCTPASLHARN